TRGAVERFIRHEREHGFGLWAVELRATGEFIGDCGLVYVEGKGPEVEVAYHLAKEWWGRGLATEAARACLDYGFRELGLREIIAICFPEQDRKSTRLNSSHVSISYAVFCLKKKK